LEPGILEPLANLDPQIFPEAQVPILDLEIGPAMEADKAKNPLTDLEWDDEVTMRAVDLMKPGQAAPARTAGLKEGQGRFDRLATGALVDENPAWNAIGR
jgi:hypothetical protein